MLFNISNAAADILDDELFVQKKVSVTVLRLDKIHPVVSGNKLFKLHYFLQQAGQAAHKSILTFGGAYSNHLVATAYACQAAGLKSIGIVRGEKPTLLSPTLQQCIDYGMQLHFIAREAYDKKDTADFITALKNEFGDCTIIPEGGYSNTGAQGAALIWRLIPKNKYTHICTATGTATTLAGLLINAGNEKIISIPVLKGMTDIEERINCCGVTVNKEHLQIFDGYHFGGYAKNTPRLIEFMNYLWQQHRLPTDFVYTAKLFAAVYDKIKKDHFTAGSTILCLHTGGLQGNLSLPQHTLLF
ncbi:1-aminocyclopropane-1-carboxylate deaminase/D-cysteine desulfhydrase [Ferruginibacter sp.]|nr:pyridoxal-phosphate dependent enzyme [Ferruginibacter sp.]